MIFGWCSSCRSLISRRAVLLIPIDKKWQSLRWLTMDYTVWYKRVPSGSHHLPSLASVLWPTLICQENENSCVKHQHRLKMVKRVKSKIIYCGYLFNSNYGISRFIPCFVHCGKLQNRKGVISPETHIILFSTPTAAVGTTAQNSKALLTLATS